MPPPTAVTDPSPTPSPPALDQTVVVDVDPCEDRWFPTPAVRSSVSSGRFELGKELARGGAAVVFAARDRDLDRDVAVKILLEEHAHRRDLIDRFRDEAKVMARLQHPGIPPVHAVGWMSDGRPFIAMKLIRGRTLYHLMRDAAADPVTRYLPAFEQVCQALAYAHSQGVIHRDVKPGNIMVGPFGEAQVMDWGLAKCLGQAESSPVRTAEGIDLAPLSDHTTRVGSMLGTPAYMAPEQARGDVDRVDYRSDVFALGAILCELLTGRPPYAGNTTHAEGVVSPGQLAEAHTRLATCRGDAALVALAVRCLDADPARRPENAAAVAAALGAYRTSVEARLRQSERDAVAEAEVRKKRKVQFALALSLAGTVAVAGGCAWWLEREASARAVERSRAERDAEVTVAAARQGISATLDQAETALRGSDWPGADAALAQADALLKAADPWADLSERWTRLQTARGVVRELDAAEGRGQTWVVNRFDFRSASDAYAGAFRKMGIELSDVEAADKVRTSVIAARLVSALGDWYGVDADRTGLAGLVDRIDPHPKRSAIRQYYKTRNAKALTDIATTIDPADLTPSLAVLLAEASHMENTRAVALLESVWMKQPQDFTLALELGNRLGDVPGRRHDAAGYLRAAVAVRPQNAAVWNNLGTLLIDTAGTVPAMACFRRCIDIDPTHQFGRLNYGEALFRLKRYAEAEVELLRAAAGDPNDPLPVQSLCSIYQETKRPDDLRKALGTLAQLAPDYARSPQVMPYRLYGLGTQMLDFKKHAIAELCLQRTVQLKPDWAEPRINLGIAIQRQGRYAEAVGHIQAGHELGLKTPGWKYPSAKWLAEARDLAGRAPRELAPPPRGK